MDIRIEDHGSIVLLRPVTGQGSDWLEHRVAYEQTWGKAIVVEPRYVADIVSGAREDGLEVHLRG